MAGTSAADLRSVLSLPAPSTPGSSQLPLPTASSSLNAALNATKPKGGRKPDGISRELYSLIGPSAPSLSAQIAKPKFKQKPNLGVGDSVSKAEKWEWREFTNSSRKDGLKLGHWVKTVTDPAVEYPFARYNVPLTTYTYSHDEYTRLLEDDHWTKEETDYLFNLVREYDMRFYVVADRYDYPGGQPRTLEDLKDRYYSVCRRLIRNRPWAGDENSKAQLLSSYTYDKERELTRKKYIESLKSRTPQQIAEEESLYIELKRLEQNERRFAREREELLRMVAGVESGLASVAIEDEMGAVIFGTGGREGSSSGAATPLSTIPGGLSDPRKKKKGAFASGDLDSPVVGSSGLFGSPQTPTRRQTPYKPSSQDVQHCIHRTDILAPANSPTAPGTSVVNKSSHSHQPAHLRSMKLPVPKPTIAPKVTQVLTELGLSAQAQQRLVMPTLENCKLMEGLYDAAYALLETKKAVDRVEQEIRVAKARLGSNAHGNGSASGSTSNEKEDKSPNRSSTAISANGIKTEPKEGGEDEDGEGNDADADGDLDMDGEVESGRARSASASAMSARNRKRSNRSVSISSVDTSATGMARNNRKRQKKD